MGLIAVSLFLCSLGFLLSLAGLCIVRCGWFAGLLCFVFDLCLKICLLLVILCWVVWLYLLWDLVL